MPRFYSWHFLFKRKVDHAQMPRTYKIRLQQLKGEVNRWNIYWTSEMTLGCRRERPGRRGWSRPTGSTCGTSARSRPRAEALRPRAPRHGQSSRPPEVERRFRTVLVVLPPAPIRRRRCYTCVRHVMANLPVHLTQKKSSELYFRPLPSAGGGATPVCATSWPIFLSSLHLRCYYSMCLHCNETPINVFPEKELRGLSPDFHIYVSVSDLYMYSHTFLGIFVSNFGIVSLQCVLLPCMGCPSSTYEAIMNLYYLLDHVQRGDLYLIFTNWYCIITFSEQLYLHYNHATV